MNGKNIRDLGQEERAILATPEAPVVLEGPEALGVLAREVQEGPEAQVQEAREVQEGPEAQEAPARELTILE